MNLKLFSITIITCVMLAFCQQRVLAQSSSFVKVENGHFVKNGQPYYYVGTNFWYGAILGSEGQGGNRERLCQELDLMKQMGIDNLRILVGSDGKRGVTTKVEPTLQVKPGVYNDTILAGLDYLLQEMGKRQMVAVLYLNNSWEWSGGYGFYLEHAGAGKQPRPDDVGYPAFMQAMSKYATNEKAHRLFYDYVKFILGRTNRYTGVAYKDDPAIMSWQIGNEPRAFSKEALPAFEKWLAEASALIRSLDPNHLISIGSEGAWGCEGDYDCWERITADKNIDYANIHLWPYNWGWAKQDSLIENLPRAKKNTKDYIDRHLQICERIKKPLVMEEFGYPRDGFKFALGTPTRGRDSFYEYVFSLVCDNMEKGGYFAGCNFWGWGGLAKPQHEQWKVGDDYTNDPAQEAQGLNSVFASDETTLSVIKRQIDRTRKSQSQRLMERLEMLRKKGYMFGHQDDPFYGLTWDYQPDSSDVKNVCGDWPAVMGFELGGIEMGDKKNLDSVPFTRMAEEIIKHHERGGIVTISWHPRNPLTTIDGGGLAGQKFPEGTAWDVTNTTVVKNILEGGSKHELFKTWMQRVSDFLAGLKTSDGQKIPIIFRPWHENTGSWFWWGEKLCTVEEYKALWNMLQDKLTADGFDNLLWAYSPGMASNLDEAKYLERYPGNDRIQLVGIDGYQWGSKEDFVTQLDANLAMLTKFAADRGKIPALTECGLKNLTDPTWWTSTLTPVLDKYQISYFLVWRNYKEEWFGPSPSKPDAPYFNEMYAKKNVLFLKEIK